MPLVLRGPCYIELSRLELAPFRPGKKDPFVQGTTFVNIIYIYTENNSFESVNIQAYLAFAAVSWQQ